MAFSAQRRGSLQPRFVSHRTEHVGMEVDVDDPMDWEPVELKLIIPDEFKCCITCSLMREPVTDLEGNTYEKEDILKWLRRKSRSPLTRNLLLATHLRDNLQLRDAIARYRHENQQHEKELNE